MEPAIILVTLLPAMEMTSDGGDFICNGGIVVRQLIFFSGYELNQIGLYVCRMDRNTYYIRLSSHV